ncbi:hypothetical protein KFK09_018165 [Dendrobium nobile]|uniref:Uncharacterized protein n=1 Tax=Dendrobium nobile TaxID=94219 RepID=A0A8T3AV29_DENNO|nr:hypothetical protein KFK09_018165 [Dendrobium nobile]
MRSYWQNASARIIFSDFHNHLGPYSCISPILLSLLKCSTIRCAIYSHSNIFSSFLISCIPPSYFPYCFLFFLFSSPFGNASLLAMIWLEELCGKELLFT